MTGNPKKRYVCRGDVWVSNIIAECNISGAFRSSSAAIRQYEPRASFRTNGPLRFSSSDDDLGVQVVVRLAALGHDLFFPPWTPLRRR